MRNLGTVRFVAHQQHFELLDVMDQELSETTGQHVLCFLVVPITNVGHQDLALESSAHPIVNTSGFPPVPLKENTRVGQCLCRLPTLPSGGKKQGPNEKET